MTLRRYERGPIRAAGAVLWRIPTSRQDGPGPEVALVHRPKYDDWTFPKGKVEPREHVLETVVREVREETGLTVRLGRRLRPAHYPKNGRSKLVDYWLATAPAECSGQEFAPNDEVDRLEWLSAEAAESRLSYQRDVEILRDAMAGPLRTTPYILLRHGSAGEKSAWRDDDSLRPLDSRGRAQAVRLAGLLAGYGARRVVSSATARCTETVLPYALGARVSVSTAEAFTVPTTTDAALDATAELLRTDVPTLVCTHGELLTALVPPLCTRLDDKAPDDPSLAKGAFWVLHVADGVLVSLEWHHS